MTIALRYAARSDVGLVRSNNQDSAYAGPHLLVVADGMGGHAGGDVASSVAVAHLAPLDDEAHRADDVLAQLGQALVAAHDELLQRAEENPELAGLGTTVTALLRSGSTLAMAHIGDSRAYLLRDGRLAQVTTDHSFVQHLVSTGKITEEEAERHPQRSVLLRVLGDFDMEIVPDMSVREALPGDRWLLCSDGLSGVVSAETLEETLRDVPDLDECAEELVRLALRGGAPDNVTVVIGDVLELDDLGDGSAPATTSHVVGAAALDRNRPTLGGPGAAGRAAEHAARAAGAERRDASHDPGGADGVAVPRAGGSHPTGTDDEPLGAGPRRRRRLLAILLVALLVAAVAVAAWLGYRWTQDRYYVGIADGRIAVYQGIPQSLGPVQLSHVLDTGTTDVDDLPGYVRDRLEQSIPFSDADDARRRMAELSLEADR